MGLRNVIQKNQASLYIYTDFCVQRKTGYTHTHSLTHSLTDNTQTHKHKQMGSFQKAWFYRDYGSVEVLEYGDVEVPQITSPDQVLIKVHAASLNPIDYNRRFGYIKSPCIPFPVSNVYFTLMMKDYVCC